MSQNDLVLSHSALMTKAATMTTKIPTMTTTTKIPTTATTMQTPRMTTTTSKTKPSSVTAAMKAKTAVNRYPELKLNLASLKEVDGQLGAPFKKEDGQLEAKGVAQNGRQEEVEEGDDEGEREEEEKEEEEIIEKKDSQEEDEEENDDGEDINESHSLFSFPKPVAVSVTSFENMRYSASNAIVSSEGILSGEGIVSGDDIISGVTNNSCSSPEAPGSSASVDNSPRTSNEESSPASRFSNLQTIFF